MASDEMTHASGRRYAVLLHGLVGTVQQPPSVTLSSGGRGSVGLVAMCATSVREHIVEANAGQVDLFVHSWNPLIGKAIDRLYKGALRASLHEHPDPSRPKALSQAMSIGRASALMSAREKKRSAQPYALALVLRLDAVVGAPLALHEFDPAAIWFAEHCCINDPTGADERADVERRCAAKRLGYGGRGGPLGKSVLGACTVSKYAGGAQRPPHVEYAYFVLDWWFAAAPRVVSSWEQIASNWTWYEARSNELRIRHRWSHFLWPIHVHDALQASGAIRFSTARISLARGVVDALRKPSQWAPGSGVPSAVPLVGGWPSGGCPVLAADGRAVDRVALLSAPRDDTAGAADWPWRALRNTRYARMADSCAASRLLVPILCCEMVGGMPRSCGVPTCNTSASASASSLAFAARLSSALADASPNLDAEMPSSLGSWRPVVYVLSLSETRRDAHYAPIYRTLASGLRALLPEAGHAQTHTPVLPPFKAADVVVWVGVGGVAVLERARRARALSIVYNTEPLKPNTCHDAAVFADEVWDYSHANLDTCRRARPSARLRFLPPGYEPPLVPLPPLQSRTDPRRGETENRALFLGYIHYSRKRCFERLNKGERAPLVEARWDAWNDSAKVALLGRYALYVNIHKHCDEPMRRACAFFRFADLLTLGRAPVLSERCHPDDEAALAGLVTFHDHASRERSELRLELKRLLATANRSSSQPPELSLAAARRRRATYAQRFSTRALFAAANLTRASLWERLVEAAVVSDHGDGRAARRRR